MKIEFSLLTSLNVACFKKNSVLSSVDPRRQTTLTLLHLYITLALEINSLCRTQRCNAQTVDIPDTLRKDAGEKM